VGDLSGDGRADIVWRRWDRGHGGDVPLADGQREHHRATHLAYIGMGWRIQRIADLDRDSYADILWRNMNAGAPTRIPLCLRMMRGRR
jgi:hypothetical protein